MTRYKDTNYIAAVPLITFRATSLLVFVNTRNMVQPITVVVVVVYLLKLKHE